MIACVNLLGFLAGMAVGCFIIAAIVVAYSER